MALSNSEKAQARAYLAAMIALAQAPEPPSELLWKIVSQANQISGVAALLVAVVALFV